MSSASLSRLLEAAAGFRNQFKRGDSASESERGQSLAHKFPEVNYTPMFREWGH